MDDSSVITDPDLNCTACKGEGVRTISDSSSPDEVAVLQRVRDHMKEHGCPEPVRVEVACECTRPALQKEKLAARLVHFMDNMGVIDSPGGAEWWRRAWTVEGIISAYDEAGTEVDGEDTAYLWGN